MEHEKDSQQRCSGSKKKNGFAAKQSGWSCWRICFDRYKLDRKSLFNALHQRFDRVAIASDNVHLAGTFGSVGAKATDGIGDWLSNDPTDRVTPQPIQPTLCPSMVKVSFWIPISNHHIGPSAQDGLDQIGNESTRILMVAIRIDNDGRAMPKRFFQPGSKCRRKSAIHSMRYDVRDPRSFGDVGGSVLAAIVDYQCLDAVYPNKPFWQISQHRRQRSRFVETGYLNDELGHSGAGFGDWRLEIGESYGLRGC